MKVLKSLLRLILLILLLLGLGILVLTQWPTDPSESPASVFAPRPKLQPLPPLKIEVLETAYSEAPEALVVQGGSFLKTKRFSHAAILIRHPKGKVVFDGGAGSKVLEEIDRVPGYRGLLLKHLSKNVLVRPLGEQAALKDLDPKTDFFLLSHGHWDHLSGFLDFPDIPIRILPEEAEFAGATANHYGHGIFPEQWALARGRIQPLQLQEVPYENFSQSLDLFGDGSLVVVPLRGHTPGSLGLFVNLPDGNRFLLVGDAVHGIHPSGWPEARTLLMEFLSDHDRMQARQTRQLLSDLIAHSNEVRLVPMHEPDPLLKFR